MLTAPLPRTFSWTVPPLGAYMHIVVQRTVLPSSASFDLPHDHHPNKAWHSDPLLDSALAAVANTWCDDPLVGLADLACFVSSFRLGGELDLYCKMVRDRTYRHTPWAHGVDVTLRFTSTTSVGMVAYMHVRDRVFETGKRRTYRRSWRDHGR
jgi:hypothetical protein